MLPARSLAPITATEAGENSLSRLRMVIVEIRPVRFGFAD
jgi:hypothetical protein